MNDVFSKICHNVGDVLCALNEGAIIIAYEAVDFRCKGRRLTLRSLTLYIYGAPILDVSRSHTTTQHSR